MDDNITELQAKKAEIEAEILRIQNEKDAAAGYIGNKLSRLYHKAGGRERVSTLQMLETIDKAYDRLIESERRASDKAYWGKGC